LVGQFLLWFKKGEWKVFLSFSPFFFNGLFWIFPIWLPHALKWIEFSLPKSQTTAVRGLYRKTAFVAHLKRGLGS